MYRSTTSFTTKDYDVRPKQILEDDFTTQEEIDEFLRIGYIEVYDDTIEITENGEYDVEDYITADVNVPSSEPTLQSKTVTLTENGTTTVQADSGYDALSSVEVDVNVPIPTVYPPNWSEIGYSNTPQPLLEDFTYSKNIYDNWDTTQTNLSNKFKGDTNLKYMPLVDTSNAVYFAEVFRECPNLEYVPNLDLRNAKYIGGLFRYDTKIKTIPAFRTDVLQGFHNMCNGCTNLVTVNLFNTHNVTALNGAFENCVNLVNVPEFDTTNLTTLGGSFTNCGSLSNESLNNILAMCTKSAIVNTARKTLKDIGLSSTQATRCQTLSNWDAFVEAGWSTGY